MRRFLNRLAGLLVVLLLMPTQLFAGGVVLTFDDWFVDQWHDFFVNPATKPPELNGIDLHVTFFVAHWLSDLKGANQGKADADNQYIKLKQLEAAGHEIGSHSLNHLDAKDAPYSLACNQATQYLNDEVRKSLDAMLIGDPNPSKAGLYQFRPQSYSYPYGSGLNVYDNTIKDNTNLQYLRGTLEDRSKLLKDTDAIYHKLGASRPYLIGDGIDFGYNNDVAEIKAALDRASANDEIITLYGHRILTGDDLGKGLLGIPKTDLLAIILYAQQKGLRFYRFSEAFQPSRVSGSCDSTTPPTLAAPSNLTATATSSTVVNLTWKDNSSNETGFKIARCSGASCSNFSQIATTATNATSYTDTTAQAATTYRYQVSAYSGTTTSTSNPLVTVTTPLHHRPQHLLHPVISLPVSSPRRKSI